MPSWSLKKAREVSVSCWACSIKASMMRGWQWPWFTADVSRQEVVVMLAFHVPEVHAFAAGQHHGQRVVVVGAVLVFEFDSLLAGSDGSCMHGVLVLSS